MGAAGGAGGVSSAFATRIDARPRLHVDVVDRRAFGVESADVRRRRKSARVAAADGGGCGKQACSMRAASRVDADNGPSWPNKGRQDAEVVEDAPISRLRPTCGSRSASHRLLIDQTR